ncbi:cytochrome P450 [Caballeronia sp. SEWSISQ10-4 2]|uniref:hypothetical protein n=1 Tax=Caballeronia sp. SEWSISQ10-4 2 TaxID=2937438 RepID=UPI0026525DB0|nr:hypothetical protein [Caballeronia sp. SEWSISQ10-4 2]MDN7184482.1 cytochrome P450 [Caballeronia sp. SEWSISQ10-4 2]
MSTLPLLAGGASPLGRPMIDDDFLENTYPTYEVLRDAGPIHWSDEFFGGAWLLTRHEDVEAMLRDPRFSARRTGLWVMNSGEARATSSTGSSNCSLARCCSWTRRITRAYAACCMRVSGPTCCRLCGRTSKRWSTSCW